MDKASQESSSVSSGLVIACLRCWDFVSLHATVTNIHLFQFPRDAAPEAFRTPLSAALLFSSQQPYISLAQAFSLAKTPKMTHTEASPGKRGVQGCSQPSNFNLLIPGAGERPKAPLHHCSCTFSPLLGLQLTESQNH